VIEFRKVLNSEIASENHRISGRKKQMMRAHIAHDELWIFNDPADLAEYRKSLNEKALLDNDEEYKHLIKGTIFERLRGNRA